MIIYKVINLVNKKVYIGQTIQDLDKRWSCHCSKGDALYNAIKKYGKENFSIEIIDNALSIEELNNKEIQYIRDFNSIAPNGYNIRLGGESGGKLSEETRKKISIAGKGRKHSKEWKEDMSERMSGENNPMYGKSPNWGKVCSEKTKEKIKLANVGQKRSEETCQKFRGQKKSESTKEKMKMKKSLPFICEQTGEIFKFAVDAANKFNVSISSINRAINSDTKTINGFTFKRLTKVKNKEINI